MNYVLKLLLVLVVGYLAGSVPFSLLAGKIFFGLDLREHGSGNLGTTNALRVLGAPAGIAVMVCDVAKGAAAVQFARLIAHAGGAVLTSAAAGMNAQTAAGWLMVVSALAAIAGHAFSPWIGFRGGKGVATTAGAMLAMMPAVFACEAVVFFGLIAVTRYVSVGSIAVAVLYPVWTVAFRSSRHTPYVLFALLAAVTVIWLHRANIVRLKNGTEPRFSIGRPAHAGAGATTDAAAKAQPQQQPAGTETESTGRTPPTS
ncbi:MAG: glycerol-3-phosphate 1-O-acyltransferase PlsY [Actinomycetes bacterium]|nr:glycerol-3-phosphate 1-O-acyltransferase PlsY [Actinomycetes bacterium]